MYMYTDTEEDEDEKKDSRNSSIGVHRPSLNNLEEAQLEIREEPSGAENNSRPQTSRLSDNDDEEEIEEIEEVTSTSTSPTLPEDTTPLDAETDRQREQSHSSPVNNHASSSLPLIEIPRRLSLQVNSSGRPIVPVNGGGASDVSLLTLNPLWRAFPTDGYRAGNKLPGGSRYFVNPVDDPSKRTPSASPSVNFYDPSLPLHPPPAFPWHEERLPSRDSSLHRPLESAQNRPSRPVTSRRNSTTAGQPRRTETRRNSSPRCTWPSTILSNADVFHLPPGGPDCHPGCGYSGLPCYVCSTKGMQTRDPENPERRARSSIFSILHRFDSPVRTHRSRGQQTFVDEDSSSLHQRVFKPCFRGLHSCGKCLKERIRLPQSRVKQLGLMFFIMYVLLIIHIGISRILRDYRL